MVVMEPFATPELMEDRSQGEITTATHPYLEDEIAAASRAIRDACGWHVAPLDSLTYTRRSRFREEVWLPAMKIFTITKVTIDGTEWADLSTVAFDEDTGWTNLCGAWVQVEYMAGFPEIPKSIERLTLELAAGSLGVALGLTREQAGGVSITRARAGGGLNADDRSVLTPYRLGRRA